MKESDLYLPLKQFLESQNYEVKGEVQDCDVLALRDDEAPVIVELKLGKLSKDSYAPIHDLPYPNPDQLRDCLARLKSSKERLTKTVIRQYKGELSYRTVKDGFFVGEGDKYNYYPFPSIEELEDKYYYWWRSALVQCF